MEKTRWWHVAVLGMATLLSALLLFYDFTLTKRIGAFCAILVLLLGWFFLGRRAWKDPRIGVVLSIIVIVACGFGVAFVPSLAIMQAFAFPLLWTIASSTRNAIIANIGLSASVATGFVFALGTSEAALVQTAITTTISLGGSLLLGLWFTHVYRIAFERQELITKLEAAQTQLGALSRDAGALGERERLAREIHDTIAQDLAGLVMTAERARRELAAGDLGAAELQISILEDNSRNALTETRALVAAGASVGVDGGFLPALNRLTERFARETGIVVSVEAPEVAGLSRDTEVVLLRCAQEGLANVRKHSRASTAKVVLSSDGAAVTLRVMDNGRGFDPAAANGFGLVGMRDRLALVDGSLGVASTPGSGTVLTATLPVGAA